MNANQTVPPDQSPEIVNGNLTCDWADSQIDIKQHYLYLAFNVLICLAFAVPTSKTVYLIYLHFLLTIAYLIECFWSWHQVCGSNLFTWSVAFTLLNTFNTVKLLIQKQEVTFSVGLLNDAYSTLFEPMAMSKNHVKKLFGPELAKIIYLEKGEAYAIENTTKADRLSLLLSGRAIVKSGDSLLHLIEPMQFLDSPEFQSCKTADEKFRVTILADTDCQVLCWQKSTLQYFLGKESFLANIFAIVLANDVSNKLYRMNEKVQIDQGFYLDVRRTLFLPSITDKLVLPDRLDDASSTHSLQPRPIRLIT